MRAGGRAPAPRFAAPPCRAPAALYEAAPPRTRKRGRPRTRGDRLPTPAELAERAKKTDWEQAEVDLRGCSGRRLVLVRDALCYQVN
ncbi:hypothetical protein [Streptomyces vastus]|uniref:Transposase n=1 Tax=Streptomyces vastus TaxID=285451 RepID=A0ABP6CS80_9ACTN